MERLKHLVSLLTEIGFSGLCDIVIVTLVVYAFLVALKRTRRSGLIFTGIVIVAGLYLAARKLDLVLTVALLQGFFAVILIALVVIFQEDLRYFFERVGLWWVERRLPLYQRHARRLPRREVEILARTLGDLARAKIGALIVVRGRDLIARHLEGGDEVEGRLSEALLKSIFDPHSIGHDGAVIIEGDRIDRLGCHLPLSNSLEKLKRSGTRHAAALGLAERSDALCLVVSEERGAISVAQRGEIRTIPDTAELAGLLEGFYEEVAPRGEWRPWREFFLRNYREKIVALALSVTLWMVVVYRAQVVQRTFKIPVNYGLLAAQLVVARLEPARVNVTFSAPRKELTFLEPEDIKLVLELANAKPGRQAVSITPRDLSYPSALILEEIDPRQVELEIGEKRPPARAN